MTKIRVKNKPLPPRRRHPEEQVRGRIRGIIEAGGIYPISPTGERNLSNLFGYSLAEIQDIIRKESRAIMQAAPEPYVRQTCFCNPPERPCTAYHECVELGRKEERDV